MNIEQASALSAKLNLSPEQLQALQDILATRETYCSRIKPATAKPRDLSWYEGADVWIEVGHHCERGGELRIAFKESPLPDYADFWVPFSAPTGEALGWLRFTYVTSIREVSVFAATEWRPASEPAPAEQVRLPLPLSPLLAGFSPDR